MKLRIVFCVALLLLIRCTHKELLLEAPITRQPRDVHFITSDIPLFWKMYDHETPLFTTRELEQEYFKAGTPALSLFYKEKLRSAEPMKDLLNSWMDQQYYEDIRSRTLRIDEHKAPVIRAMEKFQKIYPQAVFPDIVFVIGALNDGGVVLRNGQIVVAAEMFAKSKDTDISYLSPWLQSNLVQPNFLPVIILHELVHVQQRKFAITHDLPVGGRTLLDRALLEGSADFIAHLILNRSLSDKLFSYADPMQQKLWHQFRSEMNGQNFSGWLYNGNNGSKRRADLGYYIGYKICEAYYKQATNKQQAIQDMIEMKSGLAFLKKSDYDSKF